MVESNAGCPTHVSGTRAGMTEKQISAQAINRQPIDDLSTWSWLFTTRKLCSERENPKIRVSGEQEFQENQGKRASKVFYNLVSEVT